MSFLVNIQQPTFINYVVLFEISKNFCIKNKISTYLGVEKKKAKILKAKNASNANRPRFARIFLIN